MKIPCPVCLGTGKGRISRDSAELFCDACGGHGWQSVETPPMLAVDATTGGITALVPDPRIAELERENAILRADFAEALALLRRVHSFGLTATDDDAYILFARRDKILAKHLAPKP